MLRALSTIKGYYDYGMFRPIQIAAIVALRHTDAAVEGQAAIYQRRRDVLCEGLERLGWPVDAPRPRMFLWTKMPEPWAAQMTSFEFAMKLLQEADVAVSPGPVDSVRRAKAICGWPWWKTKTGSARPCGKSAAAWENERESGNSRLARFLIRKICLITCTN